MNDDLAAGSTAPDPAPGAPEQPVPRSEPAPTGGRAAARRAREEEMSSMSRTDRRRIEQEQAKRAKSRYALWKAWWLYPLLAGIAFLVYQGVQSASQAPEPAPVVSTFAPAPEPT